MRMDFRTVDDALGLEIMLGLLLYIIVAISAYSSWDRTGISTTGI